MQYGLARAAAAIDDWGEAYKLGETSLSIFAAIGHAQAPIAEAWMKALPQQTSLISNFPSKAPPDQTGNGRQ